MGHVTHVFLGRGVAWRVCLDLLGEEGRLSETGQKREFDG
jgi:hypothetical protein